MWYKYCLKDCVVSLVAQNRRFTQTPRHTPDNSPKNSIHVIYSLNTYFSNSLTNEKPLKTA